MTLSPTTFYSASAGSGKTYTLARDYLALLFQSQFNNHYRKILAVTFTNKAVAEMKERVLEHLYNFGKQPVPNESLGIFNHIKKLTGLSEQQLSTKAIKIHQRLLHDYSAFDIVTIDAFNHRILRTFAKDIDLPAGFEVELDTDSLINKAIQNLLARAGRDKELTKKLVSFSLSKIDNNKSWDVAYDLMQISALIKNENHFKYLKSLEEKTSEDFDRLSQNLKLKNKDLKTHLIELAIGLNEKSKQQGLEPKDFKGGSNSIFNTIVKVSNDIFTVSPDSGSVKDLIAGNLYAKTQKQHIKDCIDVLRADILEFGDAYKSTYGYIKFHENIIKSIVPLSLLNELLNEINVIKKEEQIVPIYEFNSILRNQIKDQPAPFIYERLGEKYRHYFIDEFQDTSRMQWENMIPLISNAVQSIDDNGNSGTLMLVGDAKQSIYRWRGSDANQFLGLLEEDYLFELEKSNQTLEFNWRSYHNVIEFNNEFFKFYGDYLNNDTYKNLYQNYLHQKTTHKKGGYTQIDFLDNTNFSYDDDDDLNTPYPPHVHSLIENILEQGYELGDICILVRKHTQGHELAQYLVKQEITVVSGDSLLVEASPRVRLLIEFMKMAHQPDQQALKLGFLLEYVQYHQIDQKNSFITQHVNLSIHEMTEKLFESNSTFMESAFAKAPLFKATEQTAQALGLFQHQDLRLQSFLELVFEFSNGQDVSLSRFLEHWDKKKEKLSVPATPDPKAVQIMTIHKSKGLEFPVVIVPYCDTSINHSLKPTNWVSVNPEAYEGFEHLYMSLSKDSEFYPDQARQVYNTHLHNTQMDHINGLYVAFTRAVEQLYICSIEKPESKSQKETSLRHGQLLKRYLDNNTTSWEKTENDQVSSFQKGTKVKLSPNTSSMPTFTLGNYETQSNSSRANFSTRRGLLWASGVQEAINKGNLLHDYMAQIESIDDMPDVILKIERDDYISSLLKTELIETLRLIISPLYFEKYFRSNLNILNERGILTPEGKKFIPDRLIIEDQQVTIIDYKTGAQLEKHRDQLDYYAALLQQMNYKIKEKVLIYTDELKELIWN
ncbi:putative ATP-dependent helicase, UvrD/REP helicase family [Flavobacteria bacterium BBFL7]|nr:putative ATP-dependent helicase, UvrD/REP helicase family [Flavobacteria bacterium BBFL7]